MNIYRPRLFHLVWNSFSLLFSFLIVVILVVGYFLPSGEGVSELIFTIDKLACAIFFGEFVFRLATSRDKWKYMKWGWVDLLASVPVTWFRFARLLKIVVIIRILIVFRRFFKLRRVFKLRYSAGDIAGFIFLFFVLCLMLMIVMGSVVVLYFEEGQPGGIQTPAEAVWWTLVTVTTVGYGDYYPVTVGGRAMALVLMFFGIGLFSTLTVYISSFLLQLFSNRDNDGKGGRAPIAITREDLALELRSVRDSIMGLTELHERLLKKQEGKGRKNSKNSKGSKEIKRSKKPKQTNQTSHLRKKTGVSPAAPSKRTMKTSVKRTPGRRQRGPATSQNKASTQGS